MKNRVGSSPTFGTKNFMSFNYQDQKEVSIDAIRWVFVNNDHLIVDTFSNVWVWDSYYDCKTDTLTIRDYENRDSVFDFSKPSLKAWIVPWARILMLEDTKRFGSCETYAIYEKIKDSEYFDFNNFISMLKDKTLGLIKKPDHCALYILEYDSPMLRISYRENNRNNEKEVASFNLEKAELTFDEEKESITLKEGDKKFTAYPLVRLFG